MDRPDGTPKKYHNSRYDNIKSKIDTKSPKSILTHKPAGAEAGPPGTPVSSKQVTIMTPRTENREIKYKQEIDRLIAELESCKAKENYMKDKYKRALHEKEKDIQGLDEENQCLLKEMAKLKSEFKAKEDELKELLDDKDRENQSLDAENRNLMQALYESDIDKLKSELENFQIRENQLKQTYHKLLDDRDQVIQSLENQIQSWQDQIQSLQNAQNVETKDSSVQVRGFLEKPETNLSGKLEETLKTKIQLLENELSTKKDDINKLRDRLHESHNEREKIHNNMIESVKKFDKAAANFQQLLFQNESMKNEIQKLHEELNEMSNKLQIKRDEKVKFLKLLEEATEDSLAKDKELIELRTRVQCLKEENGEKKENIPPNHHYHPTPNPEQHILRSEDFNGINQVLERLEKTQSSFEITKDELLNLKYLHKELQNQLETKASELNSTKCDLRIIKREKIELESEIKTYQHNIEILNEKYKKLESEKQGDEEEVNHLKAKLEKVEGKLEGKVRELEQSNEMIQNLQSKINELETKLSKANKDMENLLKLEKSEAQWMTTSKTLQQACMVLENQIGDIEKELENKTELVLNLEHKLLEKNNEIHNYINETQNLNQRLQEALNDKELTQRKLKTFEQTMNEKSKLINMEISLKDQDVQALQNEVDSLESKILKLSQEAIKYQKKISQLEHQLSNSHAELWAIKFASSDKITENCQLQEEMTKLKVKYESKISSLEDEKMSLEDHIVHLKNNLTKCDDERHKIVGEYLELDKRYKEYRITVEEQLAQKSKLIDLLQAKLGEADSKSKNTILEKVFPSSSEKQSICTWRGAGATSTTSQLNGIPSSNGGNKCRVTPLSTVQLPEKESLILLKKKSGKLHQKKTIYYQEGKQKLSINCVRFLEGENYLVGTESGMFLLHRNDEVSQELLNLGFESVQDIQIFPQINRVLFSAGSKGSIHMVPLDKFKSYLSREIKLKALFKEMELVHQSSQFFGLKFCPTEIKTYLAIVHKTRIELYEWINDKGKYSFKYKNSLHAEDVCYLFMGYKALVFVSDKVYEADYQYFEKSPIMDELDASLQRIVNYTTHSLISPLAVFMISELPTLEYLVCYCSFGVFIDSEGKRSREYVEWSHQGSPKAFAFRSKYLYAIYTRGVEIITIEEESFKNGNDAKTEWANLSDLKLLGHDVKYSKSSIYVGSFRKNETEVVEIGPGEPAAE